MSGPKISVVTAVYNRAATVRDTIESVLGQVGVDLEYIVIDGASTDGTKDIIATHESRIDKFTSEPDRGIYDALNKGIQACTGDVIGFLHADDIFPHENVLSNIAARFKTGAQATYGDLVYVDQKNTDRIVRVWKSGQFSRKKFYFGWMPPHPTVYLRRELYQRYGNFNMEMKTAADYEMMVRLFVKQSTPLEYLPETLVKMRVGGESNQSLSNRLIANRDDRSAWTVNGLRPPTGLRLMKPLRKLGQFFPGRNSG